MSRKARTRTSPAINISADHQAAPYGNRVSSRIRGYFSSFRRVKSLEGEISSLCNEMR